MSEYFSVKIAADSPPGSANEYPPARLRSSTDADEKQTRPAICFFFSDTSTWLKCKCRAIIWGSHRRSFHDETQPCRPHSDLSSLAAVWGPFHCFISTQRPMIHPTVTHQQILKLRTFIPTWKYTCTHAHSHRYVMKYIDSNQINHLYKHTHIYIYTHSIYQL